MLKRIGGLALFIIVIEVALRLVGITPGIFAGIIKPVKEVVDNKYFVTDSLGIASYNKNSVRVRSYKTINDQGFPSQYDFLTDEKKSNQKRVLLIGDSYVDGWNAQPQDSSFGARLDQNQVYEVFNFGVGGTDLLNYRLILEHYISLTDPDIVIVAVYLGNDIAPYERTPRPNVPHVFAIENSGWLASEIYDGEQVYYFDDAQMAYDWCYNELSLLGPNRSIGQKIVAKSALFTAIYFVTNKRKMLRSYNPKITKTPYPYKEIKQIDELCKAANVDYWIVGIPSPNDVRKKISMEEKYEFVFQDVVWHFPDLQNFNLKDYDGKKIDNHFNNSGHKKFYNFILNLLKE
ncbi:MAG: SGNH/GDSL hydrolase family protein [Chitinophagales bacterium]